MVVFVGSMLLAYFCGLVDTAEVLSKASNTGVITLVILLLVSIGLEKLSWLTRLSGKLITPSYAGSLLRLGSATAFFSAFVNNTAVVATLAHTVRSNRHHPAAKLLMPLVLCRYSRWHHDADWHIYQPDCQQLSRGCHRAGPGLL